MGQVDCERQALNVYRMKMLGADVVSVKAGQRTLKEAVNEAMRDWVTNVRTTHYILGTAYGAHPYPVMVRNFHRVIGDEARRQILEQEERLPDLLIACVGGGSNAIGLFYPFLEDAGVKMTGVEAGGLGILPEKHAARFQGGSRGVLQGTRSYFLQDENGQIQLTHSISAGLDYAAVGPEHAWLRDQGRVQYTYATDDQALEAFQKTRASGRHHPPPSKAPTPSPKPSNARPKCREGIADHREPIRSRRQGRGPSRRQARLEAAGIVCYR